METISQGASLQMEAITLRAKPMGEADLRLEAYSPDYGVLAIAVRGARRATSKLAGASDPLHVGRLQLVKGRSFYILTQFASVRVYSAVRQNLLAMMYAQLVSELVLRLCPHERDVASEPVYHSLRQALEGLELAASSPAQPALIALAGLWFQSRLLMLEGHGLYLEHCLGCTTPLPGAGGVGMVSLSSGGWVCEGCRAAIGGGMTPVSYGTLALLRQLSHEKTGLETLLGLASQADLDRLIRTQRFLRYHIEHVAERPIRAYALLLDQLAQLLPATPMADPAAVLTL